MSCYLGAEEYRLSIAGPWNDGDGDGWDSHRAMKRAPHSMSNAH